MPETPKTTKPSTLVREALPAMFNAFPISMRKLADGQLLLDTLADLLPAFVALVCEGIAQEIDQELDEDGDGSSWDGGMARAVEIARRDRGAVPSWAWIVPKIEHDQIARCGPRIYRTDHAEWIATEEEDAGPDRIRQLAAQMLAAADALEQLQALDQTEEATDAG